VFAVLRGCLCRALNGLHELGLVELPEYPHGVRQIGWADKQHIHAWGRGDCLRVFDGERRFDLHNVQQIRAILHVPFQVCAVQACTVRESKSADAAAGVVHSVHRLSRLLRGVDARKHDAVRAEIENPVGALALTSFHADDGRTAGSGECLHLRQGLRLTSSPVF
jgi:hypothetical protein